MYPPSPEENLREAAQIERVEQRNAKSAERDRLLVATRAEQEAALSKKTYFVQEQTYRSCCCCCCLRSRASRGKGEEEAEI